MTNDQKTSTAGSDEARDDLMATLAAARDLNPDMDKTLAERYLARRQEEQQRQDQQSAVVGQQQDRRTARSEWVGRSAVPLFCLLMLAAILVASVSWHTGAIWWFFWIPLMFGGWWWRRGIPSDGGDWRYQRRMEREQFYRDRLARRYGYYPPRPDTDKSNTDTPAADPAIPPYRAAPQIPPAGNPPQTPGAGGQFAGGAPPANPAG
ncbi:MAG: hypothetical protein C5B60_08085 [Chloroflexi bacterium]|nr:MAG: hypothetical protein C5B60_08085 [Chloroflexota bacterium]